MNSDEKQSSGNHMPPRDDDKDPRSDLPKLDTEYGMPNFGFDDDQLSSISSLNRNDPKADTVAEVEANLDIPLNEGTGWENGSTVGLAIVGKKPDSNESKDYETSGDNKDLPEEKTVRRDLDLEPEDPPQATVMPFPGATIPRATEPEPSQLLRGAEDLEEEEDIFEPPSETLSQSLSELDRRTPDTIAEAVQSALQNVYGGDPEPAEQQPAPDFTQFSVAESLRQDAEAQAAGGAGWEDDTDDFDSDRNTGPGSSETDTVLNYLYSNRRAGQDERSDDFSQPPSYADFSGFGATGPETGQERQYSERQNTNPRSFDRFNDDPDWSPPSFVAGTSPSHQSGHYPAPMATPNPESISVGEPDSSHLLGAAGLGLIGGIALAGVLAVFVFNSFVDEADQPLAAGVSPSKVIERLGGTEGVSETVVTPQSEPETTVAARSAPLQVEPREARSTELQQPQSVQPEETAVAPVIRAVPQEPPKPLTAANVAGNSGAVIPLNIKISDAAGQEAALISLKGLPDDSKLSTGIDVGAGQWLLPPTRLDTLSVTTPESLSGDFDLEVQLLKDDAQTPLSEPIPFRLSVGQNLEESSATQVSGGDSISEANEQATQLVEVTEGTPPIEIDSLTQLLIRDGNKLMRDGDILGARRLYEQAAANGNPEAALAMGRSFDPSYFEKLPIRTGTPDPESAFQWYKQALEGGLVTARVKIDGLKQWMQQ